MRKNDNVPCSVSDNKMPNNNKQTMWKLIVQDEKALLNPADMYIWVLLLMQSFIVTLLVCFFGTFSLLVDHTTAS